MLRRTSQTLLSVKGHNSRGLKSFQLNVYYNCSNILSNRTFLQIKSTGIRSMSTNSGNESNPFDTSGNPAPFESSDSVVNIIPSLPIDQVDIALDLALSDVAAPNAGIMSTLAMNFVESIHVFSGFPYWQSIIISTVAIRCLMLPLAISSIRATSRLAVARPELEKILELSKTDPRRNEPQVLGRYQAEVQAIYKKYKVNPFISIGMVFVQFPIFIAYFMGLRDMQDFYPGFCTGGAFWFTDLSAADPYMILPLVNVATFLMMIEIGADGVQMQNQGTFKWAMRGLGAAMLPLTMHMSQGLFVYWCSNNIISISQTVLLKHDSVRTFFGILKSPETAPDLKIKNPFKVLSEMARKEISQGENAKVEILDGIKIPSPPPSSSPPPKLYDSPPKRKTDVEQ
eukprot:gene6022-8294_t